MKEVTDRDASVSSMVAPPVEYEVRQPSVPILQTAHFWPNTGFTPCVGYFTSPGIDTR